MSAGLIRFGVRKPVPVNLLMFGLIIAGLVAGLSLRREFFPESDPEAALVTLPYPGATAEEIEQTLAIKVEDALASLDEVDELRTTISEGGGGITVVFREGTDPKEGLDEVERAIDALLDLPEESERIQVRLFEPNLPVIRVAVYGEIDEAAMKAAIQGVKEDLTSLPGMGEVVVSGVRGYEVRVDVDRHAMLEQGLSLTAIADTVRAWMIDVPGGTVRDEQGVIKVRTAGVETRARDIANIPLRADPEKGVLRLIDVAKVIDGFEDSDLINRFNGAPSATLTVSKVGEQDIVKIAEMVRAYIDGRVGREIQVGTFGRMLESHRIEAWELGHHSLHPLPEGAKISALSDLARYVEGRLDLLKRNAMYGAVLVFATLLLFLNWRVAFWVGVGLFTAIMGTILMMSITGVTLNLLTMFGLIVVLGLLVDDAIVVSENIQTFHENGVPAIEAGERGAIQVLWPVVATVLTSVVAFLPLTFIKGQIGDLLGALPMVVACALSMSLVESILILPSHMAHSLASAGEPARWLTAIESWRDRVFMRRLIDGHSWLLLKCATAISQRPPPWPC